MEVHQAQAFLTVAEELHFGRAASRLRMAQPPLSRLIKQLERSLGADLFERSTRHVALTAAGRALLEPARRLVEASEEAEQAVRNALTGETGRVRVGFAGASINRKVGELARQVRAARPGLMLELYSSQFSHLGLERVLDGSLDLVIGRWDFLPAEVDSAVIALEEVMVVLPAAHPLASRATVDMRDLAEEPWITLPGGVGAALQNRLNSLAMAAGFVPRVVQTAPDSWTQVVLVGAQMGCGLSLDSVRDNVSSDGVVFSSITSEDRPLEVRMIWRRADDNPALHAVIDIAQTMFPDPRDGQEGQDGHT
ncbi:LysR family transcriptional regulator [Nesterenkonia sp. PF2B19]|uniref:LysR family transcriptional regulator n=1 Tax=unclassified Nesterenkonia TaxID=2629769 RepID=UPI0008724C6C|nr:LysR family transcriptional regulator [Nesterenkonia sp. PF2B19]OSM44010.1 LysR family transcriptional regulator [Nesterenkonia sp. PF2B19]